jgi:hypothetical protein
MQSAAAPHTMWVGTSSRSVASIAAWCAGKLQIYLLLCLNSISTLCLLLLLDSHAQVPHCQPVAYPCFIPPNPTHAPMHRCLFLTPPPTTPRARTPAPPAYTILQTCCLTAGCIRNCHTAVSSSAAGGGGEPIVPAPTTAAECARRSPSDSHIVKQLRG